MHVAGEIFTYVQIEFWVFKSWFRSKFLRFNWTTFDYNFTKITHKSIHFDNLISTSKISWDFSEIVVKIRSWSIEYLENLLHETCTFLSLLNEIDWKFSLFSQSLWYAKFFRCWIYCPNWRKFRVSGKFNILLSELA